MLEIAIENILENRKQITLIHINAIGKQFERLKIRRRNLI